jgi:threonine dehydrogenase-like Zn-dependent dehydrogenase
MKTLCYSAWDTVKIAENAASEIAPDEVLLRVAACGLCGSELEAIKNRSPRRVPPLVLGHEFCGTIETVGSEVENWHAGQRVIANALVSCGHCVRCKRGEAYLCETRQIFGMNRTGAFAEFVNVPARCLLDWPENLPAEAAALAEPLANGVHMVNLSRAWAAENVVVIGAGPIGLLAQQAFIALRGSHVITADLSAQRLHAATRCGAVETINARDEDLVARVLAATNGEGADIVVDAVGAGITKKQSIAVTRPGGAAVWIGLHENEMTFDSYGVTLPQKSILGSYSATQEEMRTAIDLLASGKIDATSWTHIFPLSNGVEAVERMLKAQGDDIKAVLIP